MHLVWGENTTSVFTVSEAQYQRMINHEVEEIANEYPREDVFCFNPDVVDTLMQEWETNPAVWEQLKRFR